jgi:hypothetical protein
MTYRFVGFAIAGVSAAAPRGRMVAKNQTQPTRATIVRPCQVFAGIVPHRTGCLYRFECPACDRLETEIVEN